jgi:hypothetical protein
MRPTLLKAGIVIAGYISCFVVAWVALDIYEGLTQVMRSQSSGGMVAEGDSMVFFFVFGAAALVPTGLALYFSRSSKKFWAFLSVAGILLALTGPFMVMVNTALKVFHFVDLPVKAIPMIIYTVGLARIFLAPALVGVFFLAVLIAPDRASRKKLLIATGIEAALCLYVFLDYVLFQRLF